MFTIGAWPPVPERNFQYYKCYNCIQRGLPMLACRTSNSFNFQAGIAS